MALWDADVQLSTAYLAGDGIIISGADALSRGADVYACVLNRQTFLRIWQQFGDLAVDAWASAGARQSNPITREQLPCISPFVSENRIGVDALTTFDPACKFYAFPPVPLIGSYVSAVVRHRQPVVLVVPEWTTQAWWAVLTEHGCNWLSLGLAASIFVDPSEHPFGRNFDGEQAQSINFWAVSLFF
jgi:hypothetical protein